MALLAGPRAILSSGIIVILLSIGLGLDWIPALFVGVILANTDTVSMIELDSLVRSGVLPKSIYEEMRSSYQDRIDATETNLSDFYSRPADEFADKAISTNKFDAIRRRLLLVEKGALNEALRKRLLSEEIAHRWLQFIDEQLMQLEDA